MKISTLLAGIICSTSLSVAIESIYDGSGSLINGYEAFWGGDRDEAVMHPHSDIGKNSTVTFQWLYRAGKCEYIDIHSDPRIGSDVIINSKVWDNSNTDITYRAGLPLGDYSDPYGVSIPRIGDSKWHTVSITTKNPISEKISVYAFCRTSSDASHSDNINVIATTPTILDNNYYWLGNGSLISTVADNNAGGTGINNDYAYYSDNQDSAVTFQVLSSESCQKVTLSDVNNFNVIKEVHIKGWDQNETIPTSCTKLPCTLDLFQDKKGNPTYSLITVKREQNPSNSYIQAVCGTKSINKISLTNKLHIVEKHPTNCHFKDVDYTNGTDYGWAAKYITALCSMDVLGGYGHSLQNGEMEYGPQNTANWSEYATVTHHAKNYYQTKQMIRDYEKVNGKGEWYEPHVALTKSRGFDYSAFMETTRGVAFRYTVYVFWDKRLTDTEAAQFLYDEGVIINRNTTNRITRAEMAKVALNSLRKTSKQEAISEKIPYPVFENDLTEEDKTVLPDPQNESMPPKGSSDYNNKVIKTLDDNVQLGKVTDSPHITETEASADDFTKDIVDIDEDHIDSTAEEIEAEFSSKLLAPSSPIEPSIVIIKDIETNEKAMAVGTSNGKILTVTGPKTEEDSGKAELSPSELEEAGYTISGQLPITDAPIGPKGSTN